MKKSSGSRHNELISMEWNTDQWNNRHLAKSNSVNATNNNHLLSFDCIILHCVMTAIILMMNLIVFKPNIVIQSLGTSWIIYGHYDCDLRSICFFIRCHSLMGNDLNLENANFRITDAQCLSWFASWFANWIISNPTFIE